eukprot:7026522-Alexandrium_andersonii.AAC.1
MQQWQTESLTNRHRYQRTCITSSFRSAAILIGKRLHQPIIRSFPIAAATCGDSCLTNKQIVAM